MASESVQRVLDRVDGVHQNSPTQWAARCPCRSDDENPSLSIGEGTNGELLMTCHYGDPCSFTEICSALNINGTEVSVRSKELNASKAPKKKRKLTKVYPYEDEQGNLLYEKLRYVTDDGAKSFSHRRIDPDNPSEYIWSASGVRKVLYRLPQVIDAIVHNQTVWLVEGEKDADTLVSKGLCATTMSSGAGHWEQEFTDILAGAEFVEIIADNDEPGKKHALSVRELILAAGGNCRVLISPYGKDITDHISAGHRASELVELDYELPEGQAEEILQAEDEHAVEGELLESIKEVLDRDGLTIHQKLNRLSMVLNSFDVPEIGDVGRLVNWQEFLREADNDTYDWVIPGLLEKSERVIVVAAEGVGKTMLARQVAICAAAGMHPFTYQPMPPVRTLTIDLENPERIIRRASRSIMENAVRKSGAKEVDARLYIRPQGIDLCDPKDRMVIEQLIDSVKPQLICMGPLYKSYTDNGTKTSEALAIEVAKFLDKIRDVYGCALWLEHHAPLGSTMSTRDLRPFGSSVWSRWPEFGISITPDPTALEGYVYDVRHFRGARDKRAWPIKMKRSLTLPFEVLEFMKMD
jgi:hypothetical protein